MRKFYLFMLMAVGLLISTTMSAAPERPTPPTEPQDVAEGVLKKEVPPTVPTSFTAAPRKAAMAGEPITVLHDGVSTNYADWATMTAALEDGDEITLNADLTGNFALMKSVTLNLNEKWLKSNSGTTLSVSGNITIKNGTIQAQYTSGYGIYAISGEIQVMDVNVYSQYNPSTGYGKNNSYGPAYPLWIETGANVTVTNGFFDGYDYAAEVKGNLTLKGKADFYAWTNGIKNEFSGQVTIDGADVVVHANTHGIGNYGKVTLKQGKIQGNKYQGIYNYSQGAKITVEGGSVIGNNYGIYDAGGADFIMSGGKIEGKNYYAIYSAENGSLDMSAGECIGKTWGVVFTSATSVAVSGGSITGSSSYGLYTNQTNTTITGGRFKGTPSLYFYGGTSSVTGGEFSTNDFEVDKGYALASQDDATYKYKVVASVAHIGGTVYGSLTEALTAAQAGDEVVVDNDIMGDYIVTKAITLNTGKNTISGTVTADGVKVMVKGTGTINALAVANEGTFEIYSGTYPFNPAQYLAENISAMDNHDGTYTAGLFLARIGDDKYFFTLQEALDAVSEDGVEPTEITVLQTIDNKVEIAIYGHRKTILNLNGHTLNMLGSTSLNISKNIEDNSYEPSAEDVFTVKNGVVNSPEGGVTFYAYGGVITVENLTINNSESSGLYTTDATTGTPVYNIGEGVVVNASCSFYIGTINMNAGEINGYVYNAGATFNLNGGSVSSDKTNYCFYTGGENASLNISDGILTNSYNGTTTEYYVVFNKGGNVSVTGGKFFVPIYGEDSQIRQIFYSDNNNFDIKGGTYNVSSNDAKFGNVALASGYYCMLAAEEGWFVVDNNAVAVVNNIAYATMDAAIAAAQPNSSRIVLIKDYDGDIAIAFNDTIDLRDYKVNGIIKATNGATVFVDGKTSASANGFEGGVKVLVGTYDFDPTAFLADNCSVDTETIPGKYIVTKGVVSYNGKLYASLADAVAATTNDPAVITVLRNFGLEAPLSIASKKDITIELAGFTINNDRNYDANFSQKNLINNSGKLTIQDNTADEETGIGTGKIVYYPIDEDLDSSHPWPYWSSDVISNNGIVIVKSGIILNNGEKNGASASFAIDNAATSTLKISGGKIISNGNSYAIRLRFSATGNDVFEATGGDIGSIWGQSDGDVAGGHIYLQNVTLQYGISLGYLGSPKFEIKLANVYIQNGKFVSKFDHTETSSTQSVMIESYYLDNRFPHLSNGFFRFHDDYYHSNIYTSKVEQEKLVRPESEGWRYVQSETDPSITYIYMTAEGLLHTFHENIMPGYGLVPYINEAEGITAEDGWFEIKPLQGTTGEDSGIYDGKLGNPWHQDRTWDLHKDEVVPQDTTPVHIDHDVYVETGTKADAASIIVKSEQTLTIQEGATLIVGAGGIVFNNEDDKTPGKIVVEPGATLLDGANGIISEDTRNIIIQASETAQGTFLFDPEVSLNTHPFGTVELISRSGLRKYPNGSLVNYWHRFASPVMELKEENFTNDWDAYSATTGLQIAAGSYFQTQIYQWSSSIYDWQRIDKLENYWDSIVPFQGYTMLNNCEWDNTHKGGVTYTFKGNLVGNHNDDLSFLCKGYNYFGNSYTAPINIEELLNAVDNDDINRTVYIWDAELQVFRGWSFEQLLFIDDETTPVSIPSMQTFVMQLLNGNSAVSQIDYVNAIWNPVVNAVTSNKAPQKAQQVLDATLKINITAANGEKDAVVMMKDGRYSNELDNGADAEKYMNNGSVNFYAHAEFANVSTLADTEIEGTMLSLVSNDETEFIMTFSAVSGDQYAIRDNLTGSLITIAEGNAYAFSTNANSTDENRFEIVALHRAPTDVENMNSNATAKGIYSVTGQYLGEAQDWFKLPAGVYVLDGQKVVK
ncbi:MAG: hypothetical protein MJZ84_03310 [Paludibacteraceae bacterium]|nr:hypothetical protein [Paludibacteraceae bacterium]